MKRLLTIGAVTSVVALTAVLAAAAGGGMGSMGRSGSILRPAFHAYYDGHKDTFLSVDVSDAMEAAAMHVNFAPALKKVPLGATEEMYMPQGRAAHGQLPVFSSEPGEASYTPLWRETMVTWSATATPVLLTSDTQIEKLQKQGQLTVSETHTILNCPIVHPTKSKLGTSS